MQKKKGGGETLHFSSGKIFFSRHNQPDHEIPDCRERRAFRGRRSREGRGGNLL